MVVQNSLSLYYKGFFIYLFISPQQNLEACPCVTGYVCNIKTNIYWGQCEAVDGGSGSGSGSEDF